MTDLRVPCTDSMQRQLERIAKADGTRPELIAQIAVEEWLRQHADVRQRAADARSMASAERAASEDPLAR